MLFTSQGLARTTVLTGLCALFLAGAAGPAQATSAAKNSMTEYSYLIGSWHCVSHMPGKPDVAYSTSFHWKYPSHDAIDQVFSTPKGQADFMLVYDAPSDSFKGIWIDSNGGAGYWEDPGIENGGWTEFGYAINGKHQSPNSRAVFAGVTLTHYGYTFYTIAGRSEPGKLVETDSCDKA
jgi:hypothetical protein